MRKRYKIPLMLSILILIIFGILFMSLLIHEGTHIIQSKEPHSICYDLRKASFMRVYHNDSAYGSDEEIDEFISYTEKWAGIADGVSTVVVSMAIGMLMMCYLYESYHPKLRR